MRQDCFSISDMTAIDNRSTVLYYCGMADTQNGARAKTRASLTPRQGRKRIQCAIYLTPELKALIEDDALVLNVGARDPDAWNFARVVEDKLCVAYGIEPPKRGS